MRFSRLMPLVVSLSLAMVPQVSIAQVVELIEEAQTAQSEAKYEEAEALWRKVIQQQPNDAAAYARLGSMLFYQDKTTEGIAAFQQAIKIKASAKIYNEYADRLRDNDKLDEAIAAYQEAIKLDAKSDTPHFGLGLVYKQQEKYTEAIAAFRQAIKLKPNSSNYEALADTLADAKKFAEAIAAYRQAIKIEPSYVWLYNKVADAFGKQGKFNDAVATYRQSINLDSSNLFSYIGLADLVKFPQSIKTLTQYIKEDPKNDIPLQALGYVYKQNERLNEAATTYRQAIAIKASAENYSSLGEILLEQNKLNEANTVFRQAIALEASDYRYNELASVLVAQKKFNEALSICQKVIALKESYKTYETCSTVGIGIYMQQGLKSVMATYKQLSSQIAAKDMAEIYVNLGRHIKFSNGKQEDAIATFQEALKLNPKQKEAMESVKELKQSVSYM